MTRQRLIVTGGAGFVGRHVAEAALAAGFEVHAVARRPPPPDMPPGIAWHILDLLSAEAEAAALLETLRPSHLLHAAWCTEHGAYWSSEQNLAWREATVGLARRFAQSGGRRFLLVGSCAEYAWSQQVIVEDKTPMEPGTLYGACKLAAHRAIQAMAEGMPGYTAATGRIFFAYGPHENEARIVPYICRSLAAGEPALLSSGTQMRDFLHVEDVAQGFVTLLTTEAAGAYNVASGLSVSLGEIAQGIGKVSGREELLRLGARPDRTDDGHVLVADVTRLRALGWQPQRSLQQGLRDTYAWWAGRDGDIDGGLRTTGRR